MDYFEGNADEDKELITIEELSQRLVRSFIEKLLK